MKKVQVKMGFRGLSIPSKIQKTWTIVNSLGSNVNFPNPKPTLPELKNAASLLEAAYQQASDGGKKLKLAMSEREGELDDLISDLAAYVQNESSGDPEKIMSAGFDIRDAASEIGDLEQPLRLRATTSHHSGAVMLDWKPVHGAKTYLIAQSADGNNEWKASGHSTRSQATIEGLPAATYVWFRVAGIGTAGQGPWSDPVKGLCA